MSQPLDAAGQPQPSDTEQAASKQRYEVMNMLAEGSLGRVWLAQDQHLCRVVALKELKPKLASSAEARERFLREAQITGQLEHHSIVPVYDLNPEESYYAMRRIPGRTLSDAIDEYHRNPPKKGTADTGLQRLLGAFLRICEAVAYANERGVVHRDLKPANVQLGDYGEVFVLDWGLAKVMSARESQALSGIEEAISMEETASGKVLGTPGYMAPEQASGRPVTARADVFGLGGILYKMLTGQAPHAHIQERIPEQFLSRLQKESVPPARSVRAGVPAALEAICQHCLAMQPEERYPSAIALADDVRRWLLGEPVSVYREPWSVRVVRWGMRHPVLAQLVATVVLVGVIAVTAFTVQVWKEDEQLRQLNLRELAGHADHMETTIRFELDAVHNALETNSRLALLRGLAAEMAKPEPSKFATDTIGRALRSTIHNRAAARRLALVTPARDFREVVAAQRVGEHDAEVVAGDRLRSLAADPALQSMAARMKADPDICHFSSFLKQGDETVFFVAQPLAGTEPRIWLVVEGSCGPIFERMLAPIERKGLGVLLRNEAGAILNEKSAELEHGDVLSVELADGRADPRLVRFLEAEGGDEMLSLASAAPGDDVLLARRMHYDSGDPAHHLDVILVTPRAQIVRERSFDRRMAALLTGLVLLAVAAVALGSSRFLVRAARLRG